ncbi:MAG: molybdenum cofactor guanylyltransferase [Porticoccaceae bacterium]|nr:molybdenum cofactor guanylyltransferase [Porticoccaceae bacterium]
MSPSPSLGSVKHGDIAGVIVAGGRSSRMNPGSGAGYVPKALRLLAGKPLIDHVIKRVSPQVTLLLINTNDAPELYRHYGLSIVTDTRPGYPGPLAGLASALATLDQLGFEGRALFICPCDGPFVPEDLVARLDAALTAADADCACIRVRDELQPTFSLWHRRAQPCITATLDQGLGGFKDVFGQLQVAVLDWPEVKDDPFFNINTPRDLARAEQRLSAEAMP